MEITGKVINNKTIAAKYNTQSELFWTFKNAQDNVVLKDYKVGDEIILQFSQNEDLFIFHNSKRIELLRDFNFVDSETQNPAKIKTFGCPSCGVPLPLNNIEIIDSDTSKKSILCDYCNSSVPIDDNLKSIVLKNRQIEQKYVQLFDYLNKHFKKPIGDRAFFILNLIPYLLFIIQIAIIVIIAFFPTSKSFFIDEIITDWVLEDFNFALFLCLPSFAISTAIIFLTRKNSFSDIELLFSFFKPKTNNKNQYFCRSCGNPIKSTKTPEFIICPYCQTHNVVSASSKKFKNISDKLNIKIDEVQNLSRIYNKKVRSYSVGLSIGFIIFYGIFLAYSFSFEHLEDIGWASKFIILPFVVFILLHLFNSFALVSYSSYESAIPDNYKVKEKENTAEPLKTKIYTLTFVISKFAIWIIFFIAMFQTKKHIDF